MGWNEFEMMAERLEWMQRTFYVHKEHSATMEAVDTKEMNGGPCSYSQGGTRPFQLSFA